MGTNSAKGSSVGPGHWDTCCPVEEVAGPGARRGRERGQAVLEMREGAWPVTVSPLVRAWLQLAQGQEG